MKPIPIIILASERSGSNLLRTLLGNHKEICAPVAPHLMLEFFRCRKYYGDLRKDENAHALLRDMALVANHPYHDWALKKKPEDDSSSVHSIIEAFDRLYTLKAREEGKVHYCSKGIDSFSHVDAFRAELPAVKFVHLVRDPRDHVASWMKRPIHLLTPYDIVRKWKAEQGAYIDAVTTRGLNSISIKYEDLIADAESVMSNVLSFVGVEIDPACFGTDVDNPESKRNPYWKNLSKPIMANNKGKYARELSHEDVLLVESIAKNEMGFFGYESVSECNWVPPEDYLSVLERMRANKKRELRATPNETMVDLHDKRRFINAMFQERIAAWDKLNPDYSTSKENDRKTTDSVRLRMKYLSYGVFGESLTSRIRNKVNL